MTTWIIHFFGPDREKWYYNRDGLNVCNREEMAIGLLVHFQPAYTNIKQQQNS